MGQASLRELSIKLECTAYETRDLFFEFPAALEGYLSDLLNWNNFI
jgi:hypothetical protein